MKKLLSLATFVAIFTVGTAFATTYTYNVRVVNSSNVPIFASAVNVEKTQINVNNSLSFAIQDDGATFTLVDQYQTLCGSPVDLTEALSLGMKNFTVTVTGTDVPGDSHMQCSFSSN